MVRVQLSTLKPTSLAAACLHHQHMQCACCGENRSMAHHLGTNMFIAQYLQGNTAASVTDTAAYNIQYLHTHLMTKHLVVYKTPVMATTIISHKNP